MRSTIAFPRTSALLLGGYLAALSLGGGQAHAQTQILQPPPQSPSWKPSQDPWNRRVDYRTITLYNNTDEYIQVLCYDNGDDRKWWPIACPGLPAPLMAPRTVTVLDSRQVVYANLQVVLVVPNAPQGVCAQTGYLVTDLPARGPDAWVYLGGSRSGWDYRAGSGYKFAVFNPPQVVWPQWTAIQSCDQLTSVTETGTGEQTTTRVYDSLPPDLLAYSGVPGQSPMGVFHGSPVGTAQPPADIDGNESSWVPVQKEIPEASDSEYSRAQALDIAGRLVQAINGAPGFLRIDQIEKIEAGRIASVVSELVTARFSSVDSPMWAPELSRQNLSRRLYTNLFQREPDLSGDLLTRRAISTGNLAQRVLDMIRSSEFPVGHLHQSLGGSLVGTPAAITQGISNSTEVFARGTDNGLWHIRELSPGSNTWSGWESFGGATLADPVVAQNSDKRLEVFVRCLDNSLCHLYQQTYSRGWSGWASLGGEILGKIAVATNEDGRLEVFVRRNDLSIWHIWQNIQGGTTDWSHWESLGGAFTSDPIVNRDDAGRLHVFARCLDGQLCHRQQGEKNSGWTPGWNLLGAQFVDQPTVVKRSGGDLDIFTRAVGDLHVELTEQLPSGWTSAMYSSGWGSLSRGFSSDFGAPEGYPWGVPKIFFARCPDSSLCVRQGNESWMSEGADMVGAPAVASGGDEVFYIDSKHMLRHRRPSDGQYAIAPPSQARPVVLRNVQGGTCLRVANDSGDLNANSLQGPCDTHTTGSYWTWVGTGEWRMLKNLQTQTCLNVEWGLVTLNAETSQSLCDPNNPATLWKWTAGNGGNQLLNKAASTCLNVEGGSSANGANAHQWECNANNPANLWVDINALNGQ